MSDAFRKPMGRIIGEVLQDFIFFILFYLYLWLVVDVRFIYYGGGETWAFPFFNCGLAFFQQSVSSPGGLVEYVGSFLSEFLYYSWAGALVITLVAWLLCSGTNMFLKAVGARGFLILRFVLPIILLILYGGYTHFLNTAVAMAAALFFVYLYLRARRSKQPADMVIFLVLSVVLYWVAGGAYLLFVVLCLVYELFFAFRWKTALSYLAMALITVYVEGALIFDQSVFDSFCRLTPFDGEISFNEPHKGMLLVAYVFFLALPSLVFLLGLGWILVKSLGRVNSAQVESHSGKAERVFASGCFFWCESRPVLKWTVEIFVLLVITGACVFFSFNRQRKCIFAVDYYAYYKEWDNLLKAAKAGPARHFAIAHAVNKALYYTGRLGSRMFAYRQHPDALFLSIGMPPARWKRYGLHLELGLIGTAETELVESWSMYGNHPVILKDLALINMVKGNMKGARCFLGMLAKTIFHRRWAKRYLEQLKVDPDLSEDSRIRHLRSIMTEVDTVDGHLKGDARLLGLLEKNRQNRMAFEYMMAGYLLGGQLDKIIANIHRLDDFGFKEIPRHYEEAILIYERLNGAKANLGGRQISRQSQQRYEGFLQVYSRHMSNMQAAYQDLQRDYGDSYFFYYLYDAAGKI